VLKQHNRRDEEFSGTAGEVARELLDRHQLQKVKVEVTDLGDHYDPETKAVRLGRDKFHRKSLTAVTTAAHEVAHALQDASDYGPFVWRTRLVKVAQVTGDVGSVLLLAVPVAALITRQAVPPIFIGAAAVAMLGTGVAAQVAALPSELDASFGRALPLLRADYITGEQVASARKILLACSLTYVASSLVAVMHIWPWLGRRPAYLVSANPSNIARTEATEALFGGSIRKTRRPTDSPSPTFAASNRRPGVIEQLVRVIAKPVIRGWLLI
jgi:Zn-dependent membrane protease YugP